MGEAALSSGRRSFPPEPMEALACLPRALSHVHHLCIWNPEPESWYAGPRTMTSRPMIINRLRARVVHASWCSTRHQPRQSHKLPARSLRTRTVNKPTRTSRIRNLKKQWQTTRKDRLNALRPRMECLCSITSATTMANEAMQSQPIWSDCHGCSASLPRSHPRDVRIISTLNSKYHSSPYSSFLTKPDSIIQSLTHALIKILPGVGVCSCLSCILTQSI
jgi:hypothetical protein